MLAIVLVPTVSRAMAAADPQAPWSVVCSSADAARGDARKVSAHLDQCPLCVNASAPAVLPPAGFVPAWHPLDTAAVSAAVAQPARPRRNGAQAQPRGPPRDCR